VSVAPKVPDSIMQIASDIANNGSATPGSPSTPFVHVRPDGRIELVIRSASAIGAGQEGDLNRLGVQVVAKLGTNAVQAWVPAGRVQDVAALAWVSGIEAPRYSTIGG
jgi:hypothetical protein